MGHRLPEEQSGVLGHHIIPPLEEGRSLGQAGQGDGGPGAGPLAHTGVSAGGPHQPDDVVIDLRADENLPHLFLGLLQSSGVHHLLGPLEVPLIFPPQQLHFGVMAGVAQGEAEHEPVQLGVGEQLGPGRAGGVLGGDDGEGLRDGPGHPVHRHGPFLHGLQQSGLGTAPGPVDLVGQKEIAEHRPFLVAEGACLLVIDGKPGDI